MKKIKFLIASMLGAIALVFACVLGTKVNAKGTEEVTDTYTYDVSVDTPNVDVGSTGSMNGYLASDTGKNNPKTITIGVTSNSTASNALYLSSSIMKIRKYANSTAPAWYFTFTVKGSGNITIPCKTGGNSKYIDYSIDGGTETPFASKDSFTNIVIPFTTAGEHTVNFVGQSNATSDIQIDDFTITETYTAKTFDITYNANGHGTAPAKVTDKKVLSSTELPTLDNDGEWTFDGWYFEATCTNEATTASNLDTYDVDGDVTLYARWVNPNSKYTVTFYSEGTQYGDPIEITYDGLGNATIGSSMPSNPFKLQYSFAGWYTADGSSSGEWGTKVESNTTITSSMVTSNALTLYAKFTLNVLSVNTTYSFDASKTTSNSDGSIINSNDGTFFIDNVAGKGVKVSGSNFSIGNGLDSTTGSNYLAFNLPAKSYAIISLTAKRASDSDATKYARLYFNNENTQTGDLTTEDADYSVICYNNTDAVSMVKVYRNGNKTVTVSKFDVAVYSSVTTINEAQSRGTGTAIRFAATLSNVGSLDVVTKWNYTLSMDGKTDVVGADKTTLYTSISGTNGKAAADNTYYIVLTVKDIPSSFNGKTLKCKFTITLSDGSTINTEVVSQIISITA